MKFVLSVLLTALLSLMLQLFLPWWSLVVAAFVVGAFISLSRWLTFFSGLLGTGLVWWTYALMIDIRTQSVLSEKIAMLFHVGSPLTLILLTGLLAGLVGGFAALSGKEMKRILLNS